ncbi:MAG: GGDEF domain-containing protein [Rubrivivax sp.]|nr:MAG: GGDEF domain-containing protein [Rubrivivax sp.]
MNAAAPVPGKRSATRAARPSHPIVNLLLTNDPRLRTALGLSLLGAVIYLGWVSLIWLYIIPQGLSTRELGYLFSIHHFLAILAGYPLVRSGLTRRLADPSLVAIQLAWASAAVVMGYAVTPEIRSGVLQTLCLIQVFGFISLRPRSATLTGAAMIVMLLVMWMIMSSLHSPTFDPTNEALKIFPTCFILGLLVVQSRNFGLSRQRMSEEKKALAAAVEKVEQIALHDALTGLFNRQHLQTRIDAERDRAARSGHGFSIALIDLDHFKNVNDIHGHHVGDDVLVSFAEQAQAILRDTDVVGRWGGEEFVVVMPETDPAHVATIGLNRLKQALSHTEVSQRVPELRVTFSAGVAAWHAGESTEQLMQRADRALYAAKAGGRDRCEVAT